MKWSVLQEHQIYSQHNQNHVWQICKLASQIMNVYLSVFQFSNCSSAVGRNASIVFTFDFKTLCLLKSRIICTHQFSCAYKNYGTLYEWIKKLTLKKHNKKTQVLSKAHLESLSDPHIHWWQLHGFHVALTASLLRSHTSTARCMRYRCIWFITNSIRMRGVTTVTQDLVAEKKADMFGAGLFDSVKKWWSEKTIYKEVIIIIIIIIIISSGF